MSMDECTVSRARCGGGHLIDEVSLERIRPTAVRRRVDKGGGKIGAKWQTRSLATGGGVARAANCAVKVANGKAMCRARPLHEFFRNPTPRFRNHAPLCTHPHKSHSSYHTVHLHHFSRPTRIQLPPNYPHQPPSSHLSPRQHLCEFHVCNMFWLSVVALLIACVVIASFRQRHANQLMSNMRKVISEMVAERKRLASDRDSARANARESARRNNELSTFRQKIESLTASLNAAVAERNSLELRESAAQQRIEVLSKQLGEQEAMVVRLKADLVSSEETKWAMIRRAHDNICQNVQTHFPPDFPQIKQQNRLSLTDSPTRGAPSVPQPSEIPETSSEDSSKPDALAMQKATDLLHKFPSRVAVQKDYSDMDSDNSDSIDLMTLHPDLTISDRLEPFEYPPDFSGIGLSSVSLSGSEPDGARPAGSASSPTVPRVEDDVSLSLNRAPWAEALNGTTMTSNSQGSLINAIKSVPRTNSGLLRLRSVREKSSSAGET